MTKNISEYWQAYQSGQSFWVFNCVSWIQGGTLTPYTMELYTYPIYIYIAETILKIIWIINCYKTNLLYKKWISLINVEHRLAIFIRQTASAAEVPLLLRNLPGVRLAGRRIIRLVQNVDVRRVSSLRHVRRLLRILLWGEMGRWRFLLTAC